MRGKEKKVKHRGRVLPLTFVLALVPQAWAGFQGRVFDGYTRQPVPRAEVFVYESGELVFADSLGWFEIPVESTLGGSREPTRGGSAFVSLEISRIGYETREWSDISTGRPVALYLNPVVIDLEGVTVTAFRTPIAVDKSGPVAVLRPHADPAGQTSIDAAVGSAPAVLGHHYVNFSSRTLRGTNASQTLCAIDGIRLNSAMNGTCDLTTLPLHLAERVEVSRGGGSALYGSSAVGGLFNVISPEPGSLLARLRLGLGALGKKYLELRHTNWFAPVGYCVGVSLDRAENRFDCSDRLDSVETTANADITSRGFFGKLLSRQGGQTLSLLGEYAQTERGAWPSDSARREDRRGLAVLEYSRIEGQRGRTEAKLFTHQSWQEYHDPDPSYSSADTHRLTSLGGQLDQVLHFDPYGTLLIGFEANSERLSSSLVREPERLTLASWLSPRFEFLEFGLNPTVRFERVSQERRQPDSNLVGNTHLERSTLHVLSPRFVLTYSGLEWFGIYASASRSFRAPTFNELYWPVDTFDDWAPYVYVTHGNGELVPEWSTSFDFGVSGKNFDFLRYWLGCYYSGLTNMIDWSSETRAETTWTYPVNIDSATISGLEADCSFDFGSTGLDGNYNLCLARTGEKELAYRPQLSGRATVWAELKPGPLRTRLNLSAEHSGKRYTDVANTDSLALAQHLLFDAGASVGSRLGPGDAILRFGIRNFGNQRYETVRDYPMPGRTWYAELEIGI